MKKNKKILAGITALGIVATIAVGGTFAYLTDLTEKRANNFTFSEPISAILTEPAWDGVTDYLYPGEDGHPGGDSGIIPIYGWDDTDPSDPKPIFGYKTDNDTGTETPVTTYQKDGDGVGVPPTKDADGNPIVYGNTTNQNMIPGQAALKNPKITNTSTDIDEWVAAQVSFVYADSGRLLNSTDMQCIVDSMYIDWNTGTDKKWELIGDEINQGSSQYTFYYKETLSRCEENARYGGETDPIFNYVKVNGDASNDEIGNLNKIAGGKGFVIYIEGFAVQNSVAESYTDFKTWANGTDGVSNVTFMNSPSADRDTDLNLANGGIIAKNSSGIVNTPEPDVPEGGGA